MAFRTKLDFSSNRQVKQRIETFTHLSGGTAFGVPFSSLPTGPDLRYTGVTFSSSTVLSTFSGNSANTVYSWYYPEMNDAISSLSAITPSISGITQNGIGFSPISYTIIDGNTVATGYSGITFDVLPVSMTDLGGGNYVGSVQTELVEFLSAATLDFTGRTIWNDVSGITRTEDLIITRTPIVGAVLECIDGEGKASWIPTSASTSGLWVAGTGLNSAVLNGGGNVANGINSVSEGTGTITSGTSSHAEGYQTKAWGEYSHTEGVVSNAWGNASHAEGGGTKANLYMAFGTYISGTTNNSSFALYYGCGDVSYLFDNLDYLYIDDSASNASFSNINTSFLVNNAVFTDFGGYSATVITLLGTHNYPSDSGVVYISNLTTPINVYFPYAVLFNNAHAEGQSTLAVSSSSHAEGNFTIAGNAYSHAEGNQTKASGYGSHAEGGYTIASGSYSHVEGNGTKASDYCAHAEGQSTIASGSTSHAEGYYTKASGISSHAEGNITLASGTASHAQGLRTLASGIGSHAQGTGTTASGDYSHAEGFGCIASGDYSHAQGVFTLANGAQAHAEGFQTTATTGSHSEGYYTLASQAGAHAEGQNTRALGIGSHAQGLYCIVGANGNGSFAGGQNSETYAGVSMVFGANSMLLSGATYSIVLGRGITGTTQDTTYVDKFNVKTVGSTAFANDIRIDANGNLTTNTSDERLKENITPLSGALATIQGLQGVSYQWKDRNAGTDAVKLGFIAQQVDSVDSRLAFTNPVDGYMGLHIDGIIPLLVEAVKELASGGTSNDYLQTQTILAEDNNIELNYSGTPTTALGGGLTVLHGMGIDLSSELIIDADGNWTTNNDFIPNKITLPAYTPSGSTDTSGNLGNVTRDDDYLYMKISDNKWKRIKLEEF